MNKMTKKTSSLLPSLLDDNDRLKIEHKLSFDEANRLGIENMQVLHNVSMLQSVLTQCKQARTQALNECSKLKAEFSESEQERNKALGNISRLRSNFIRCETEKEQAFSELSRLKTELSE